jgi:pyruvate,water dikinase
VPSLSYGTHFYQDLVEANIHSLPLHLEDQRSQFKWGFFREANNYLAYLSPADANLEPFLKLIDLQMERAGYRLSILMDGSRDETAGYLVLGDWQDDEPVTEGTISIF